MAHRNRMICSRNSTKDQPEKHLVLPIQLILGSEGGFLYGLSGKDKAGVYLVTLAHQIKMSPHPKANLGLRKITPRPESQNPRSTFPSRGPSQAFFTASFTSYLRTRQSPERPQHQPQINPMQSTQSQDKPPSPGKVLQPRQRTPSPVPIPPSSRHRQILPSTNLQIAQPGARSGHRFLPRLSRSGSQAHKDSSCERLSSDCQQARGT